MQAIPALRFIFIYLTASGWKFRKKQSIGQPFVSTVVNAEVALFVTDALTANDATLIGRKHTLPALVETILSRILVGFIAHIWKSLWPLGLSSIFLLTKLACPTSILVSPECYR